MGKQTLIEWIREKIAGFGWWLFLTAEGLTVEQYRELIREDIKREEREGKE